MKNMVRLVVIGLVVLCCIILSIAILHVVRTTPGVTQGISNQETEMLLKELWWQEAGKTETEQKKTELFTELHMNQTAFLTRENLMTYLRTLAAIDERFAKMITADGQIEARELKRIEEKYDKKQVLLRDDWFVFYQGLCGKLQQDEEERTITIEETFLLQEQGDVWVTDGRRLTNKSIEELKPLTQYRVVLQKDMILSVWKQIDTPYVMHNVWLVSMDVETVNCFYQNMQLTILNGLQSKYVDTSIAKIVADLTIVQQNVTALEEKRDMISGKVLRIDDNRITLAENQSYEWAEHIACYQIYGNLQNVEPAQIPIGYEYADFVMENERIAAILLTREEHMKNIRVLLKNEETAGYFYDDFACTAEQDFTVKGNQIDDILSAGSKFYIRRDDLPVGSQLSVQTTTNTGVISCIHMKRAQGIPSYHGVVNILSTEQGLVLINEVLLEEYLYSVVPSEMPPSYPQQALQAQAICARTYAYQKMRHALYPQYGAHLDDSTACQVYNNMEENHITTKAVNETFGKIVCAQGEPIDTYYYSTSCGFGTTEEIWGNGKQFDYIQPCEIAPEQSEWTAESLQDEESFHNFLLYRNKNAFEYAEAWYRWEYHFVASLDEMNTKLQTLYEKNPKLVVSFDKQEQAWVQQAPQPLAQIDYITITERLPGGVAHKMEIQAGDVRIQIMTEQAIRTMLANKDTMLTRQDGSQVAVGEKLPSAFLYIQPMQDESSWEIYGGGYGHGVGMSQNAAANMARCGYKAEEILQFFFQAITIEDVYL